MRSVHYLFVFFLVFSVGYKADAQNASRDYVEPNGWQIGTDVGESDLWADVGTKSFIDHYSNSHYFDKVVFLAGMFGRYTVHPCFSLRFMVNYGTLYATDKWNEDKAKTASSQGADAFQRYARNQDAKDNIFENSLLLELSPFRFNPESKAAHRRGQLFITAGVSIFHFQPYSTVANSQTWVKTYDLHLEGQGFGDGYPSNYSLWQVGIPMGFGYRWDLGKHLNFGFEFIYRMTFTDYLDGVSGKYISPVAFEQHLSPHDAALAESVADKGYYTKLEGPNVAGNLRGNSSNKDAYSSFSLTLSYKVLTRTREWWH